jgi:hypothetical protein
VDRADRGSSTVTIAARSAVLVREDGGNVVHVAR